MSSAPERFFAGHRIGHRPPSSCEQIPNSPRYAATGKNMSYSVKLQSVAATLTARLPEAVGIVASELTPSGVSHTAAYHQFYSLPKQHREFACHCRQARTPAAADNSWRHYLVLLDFLGICILLPQFARTYCSVYNLCSAN